MICEILRNKRKIRVFERFPVVFLYNALFGQDIVNQGEKPILRPSKKYKARAGLETENSSKKSRTKKGAALAFFR
ncbi:MAG: hypothetical protein J6P15_05260 [Fibrobacter sp.]|nr:hypothetical protein [Fibrobacter sp.]